MNRTGATFYQPTVLVDMTVDMKPFQEETFGPVAPLLKFKTEEEAVVIANNTKYGLFLRIKSARLLSCVALLATHYDSRALQAPRRLKLTSLLSALFHNPPRFGLAGYACTKDMSRVFRLAKVNRNIESYSYCHRTSRSVEESATQAHQMLP